MSETENHYRRQNLGVEVVVQATKPQDTKVYFLPCITRRIPNKENTTKIEGGK